MVDFFVYLLLFCFALFNFFFCKFTYLFIFGCVGSLLLHAGFSLVAASGGYSSVRCVGFSLRWLLLLQSTGSRVQGLQYLQHTGSVAVAHRLQSTGSVAMVHGFSCSATCGIFLDQSSNTCPPSLSGKSALYNFILFILYLWGISFSSKPISNNP